MTFVLSSPTKYLSWDLDLMTKPFKVSKSKSDDKELKIN